MTIYFCETEKIYYLARNKKIMRSRCICNGNHVNFPSIHLFRRIFHSFFAY